MHSNLHRGEHFADLKKKILILYSHYLPGVKAGGPVQSIAGLLEGLKDEFDFKIICGDRDAGDRKPFANEPVGRWYEYGRAKVLRIPPGPSGAWMMIRALRLEKYDLLYINGVLPRIYSMLPLTCRKMGLLPQRPVVLAPRGEFSQGALSLKSNRKQLYLKLSTWLGLYREIIWHASTNLEVADIRRLIGNLPTIDDVRLLHDSAAVSGSGMTEVIAVAKDMQVRQEHYGKRKICKRAGALRAVFVSRILPMKNLLFALKMLQGLSGDVYFDIYGFVGDAEYWNQCKKTIDTLPANVRVKYRGFIEHERVGEVFAEHELFILPTLGENYGHVICEALSAGCPVLISDQTPWRNLQEKQVGWDIPLDKEERFLAILQQCVDADEEWHAALAERAAEYGQMAASDPEVIEENRRMFRYAISVSVGA